MDVGAELLKRCFCEHVANLIKTHPLDAESAVNNIALNALREIKGIVTDDDLDDFEAMEQITYIFQKYDIDFGERHNFD